MVLRFDAAPWIAGAVLTFAAPGCNEAVDVCTPHAREACYSGPAGTDGVGQCHAGTRTCAEDGRGFGPCEGEVLPTPEDCAAPGDEDCDGHPSACTGDTLWAKGLPAADYEVGFTVDREGRTTVGGECGGASFSVCLLGLSESGDPTFDVEIKNSDYALIASDAAGDIAGVMRFQEPITIGGETITPVGDQDVLLVELDSKGAVRFYKHFGGSGYLSLDAIHMDPAGDLLLAGYLDGSVDFGSGPLGNTGGAAFVARLDPSGAPVLTQVLPPVQVRSAHLDSQGNVLLSGYFEDTVNFGGETLQSIGQEDWFVVKLGPSGEHVWSSGFGGSGVNHLHWLDMAVDGLGNVYLSGTFSDTWDFGGGPVTALGETDAFVVKLDPDGGYLWGRFFGSGQPQQGQGVAIDPFGNVLLALSFAGSIDLGAGKLYASSPLVADVAVAKLTPGGDTVWSRRFGNGSNIGLIGIGADGAGDVFVTGSAFGPLDFGSLTLPAPPIGAGQLFVARLSP